MGLSGAEVTELQLAKAKPGSLSCANVLPQQLSLCETEKAERSYSSCMLAKPPVSQESRTRSFMFTSNPALSRLEPWMNLAISDDMFTR